MHCLLPRKNLLCKSAQQLPLLEGDCFKTSAIPFPASTGRTIAAPSERAMALGAEDGDLVVAPRLPEAGGDRVSRPS